MQIPFNLSNVFGPDSSSQDDSLVLRALLNVLLVANRAYLRTHAVPNLYRSGVRYGRTDDWLSIPELYAQQIGDCKSLACVRIVELERQGIDVTPDFRWASRSDGAKDFHILVKGWHPTAGLMYEDPSRKLGMGKDEVARFYVQGEQLNSKPEHSWLRWFR